MPEELNPEVDAYIIAELRREARAIRTPGTVEWAENVELPPRYRPFKRLGALATCGEVFYLKKVGMSPLPQYMTRGDLVRTAVAHEETTRFFSALEVFSREAAGLVQDVQNNIEQTQPKPE